MTELRSKGIENTEQNSPFIILSLYFFKDRISRIMIHGIPL